MIEVVAPFLGAFLGVFAAMMVAGTLGLLFQRDKGLPSGELGPSSPDSPEGQLSPEQVAAKVNKGRHPEDNIRAYGL